MNDGERTAAYGALRTLLVNRGYEWVVSQAEDEIREGKTLELKEPVTVKLPGRQRTSRIESGMVTVSFTPLQRLEILVAAVRRATVIPPMLEAEVVAFFLGESATDARVTEIRLGDESSDDGVARTLSSVDDTRSRVEAARALEGALNALLVEARG